MHSIEKELENERSFDGLNMHAHECCAIAMAYIQLNTKEIVILLSESEL